MATGNRSTKVSVRSSGPRWRLISGAVVLGILFAGFTWVYVARESTVSADAQYRGGPRLAVETDLIDFGPVKFNTMVQAVFRLRNIGDQPLTISSNPQVEVAEGC